MTPDPSTVPAPAPPDFEPVFIPYTAHRKFQQRWTRHIVLFLLTVGTTTVVGINNYASYISDFGTRATLSDTPGAGLLATSGHFIAAFWLPGLVYSASILAILGAHEMGHYLACRWYNVDATLPFFIPFPSLVGTMGAVIRIREPFPTRTALFDIGLAGPIAGFVVLLPLLFWGMHLSTALPVPSDMQGVALGEPLLFKFAEWLQFGSLPSSYSVNMHPMAFAAWFGMLATAWNLLPFGQLDGGHVTYATLGESSRWISIVTVSGCIVMCYVSYSWILMTLMLLAMLYFLGSRHPRVIYEYEPLAPGRRALAVFAIVMMVLCITPVPIDVLK